MKKVQFSVFSYFLLVYFLMLGATPLWSARYDCVKPDPLDGYTFHDAQGETFHATHEQLEAAQENVAKHVIDEIRATPWDDRRKEGNTNDVVESYCLFHTPERAYTGTVIFFHGFSNRPKEMAPLASYMFHSGMNVYNVWLSSQYKTPGTKFWPKLTYRKDVIRKVLGRPGAMDIFNSILATLAGNGNVDVFAKAGELLAPDYKVDDIKNLYDNPDVNSPDWQKIFDAGAPQGQPGQGFRGWIDNAKERLKDVSGLPGPVFVVGLSAGASVALNLAAEDDTGKIRGVVAHAPYLEDYDENQRNKIKFLGPFDNQKVNGEKNTPEYSVASASAQHALGGNLFRKDNLDHLSKISTFIVTTKCDRRAHTERSWDLASRLAAAGGNTHLSHAYEQEDKVGHAMTDPLDYENPDSIDCNSGGGRNYHYRTLYQETLRFFIYKDVHFDNMRAYNEDESFFIVNGHVQQE